jgi:ABC-type cobalamin/Fe3+-siderophores transport system ATPase subunit
MCLTFPLVFWKCSDGKIPALGIANHPKRKITKNAQETLKALGIDHLKDKPYTNISGERGNLIDSYGLRSSPDFIVR